MFPTKEPASCFRPGQAKLAASQRAVSESPGLIEAAVAMDDPGLRPLRPRVCPWLANSLLRFRARQGALSTNIRRSEAGEFSRQWPPGSITGEWRIPPARPTCLASSRPISPGNHEIRTWAGRARRRPKPRTLASRSESIGRRAISPSMHALVRLGKYRRLW